MPADPDFPAGRTFFLVDYDVHLWMIVSDPALDADQILLFNFTSHDEEKESVCIIAVGEHPFVRKPTSVCFRKARRLSLRQLRTALEIGKIAFHVDLSPSLLRRIRNATSESRRVRVENYEPLLEQGLIELDDHDV